MWKRSRQNALRRQLSLGRCLMNSERVGAVTGAVCVPGMCLSAGLLLTWQVCEWELVGSWGFGACSAPQNCRLLAVAPPKRRVGILAGTVQGLQFAMLV